MDMGKGWGMSFGWKSGKAGKVIISTISTHQSNTYGYGKGLRNEFWMKKRKTGESNNKYYFYSSV